MTEIIFGPPGCGKTTTLLGIVDEELARGMAPDRIGFVSFTRKAAHEAAFRAGQRLSLPPTRLPWFRTLHSLCYRRLGLRRTDVMNAVAMREFADYAGITLTGKNPEDDALSELSAGDRALFLCNLARVRCLPLRQVYEEDEEGRLDWYEVQRVDRCLRAFKDARVIVDYTDMLDVWTRSGDRLPLDLLIVDEAQDLSQLQWQVVARLSETCRRVVVAGDDDQAIYRWAGADAEHLLTMGGSRRVLDQSWRVPRRIQAVAASLAGKIQRRVDKVWRPRDEDGEVCRATDVSGVDFNGEDIVVLVRNHQVARQAEDELRHQGIVYERGGRPSIPDEVLRAARTWEKLRRGGSAPAEEVAEACSYLPGWRRPPNLPHEASAADAGLAEGQAPWHDALQKLPRDDVAYVRTALARGEKIRERPRVRISTIHASKGGEADHVVLFLETARRTAREAERLVDDELRVWYVAATRARQTLTIVDSPTRMRCEWL